MLQSLSCIKCNNFINLQKMGFYNVAGLTVTVFPTFSLYFSISSQGSTSELGVWTRHSCYTDPFVDYSKIWRNFCLKYLFLFSLFCGRQIQFQHSSLCPDRLLASDLWNMWGWALGNSLCKIWWWYRVIKELKCLYHLNIPKNESIVQIKPLSQTAQLWYFLKLLLKIFIWYFPCFFNWRFLKNQSKINAPTMLEVVISMSVHIAYICQWNYVLNVMYLIIPLTNSTHSHLHIFTVKLCGQRFPNDSNEPTTERAQIHPSECV